MKIIDLLIESTARHPETIAVRDDVIELTYSQLSANVDCLSDYLTSNRCPPGAKVAILLPNSALYFISFFALSAAKVTIVPMSSKMTVYEAAEFIKRADVSIAITEKSFAKKLSAELKDKNQLTIITLQWDHNRNLQPQTITENKTTHNCDNHDTALMVYTSGTTGNSKIVMLTDGQLTSNMSAYRSTMAFDSHNIVYCSLLLHHIYSICAQLLTHISLADTFITKADPFFIKDFFRAVQKNRITITAFVPYMAMLMADYPHPHEFDTSTLKYVTLSGAKTPVHIYQKLTQAYPHIKFINTYGMSEAGSRISLAAPNPQNFPIDSVGKPVPGVKVKITDKTGSPLKANHIGQVEVKSSGVFKGYYKQPELIEETIIDGWLKTGDLGKLDNDGNLFLAGRIKEMILCGGENIYPAQIEQCLSEHPSIIESAVVGIPDKKLEEVPYAFVVSKDKNLKQIDIIKFCQKKLSSFKIPRKVLFVSNIPKLGTSKINRIKLKEIAMQKNEATS